MCSLKVLEPCGSPTQCLLQLLAERDCTLKYLLGCLEKMGHTQACQVLSSAGRDGQWGPTGPGEVHWGTAEGKQGEMKSSPSCWWSCSG